MTKRVFSSGFLNSDLQHNSWYSGCVKINCSFSVKYYPLLACFAVRVRQDGYSFLIYLFLNLLSFWFLWGVYIIITSQFSMKIENFQFSVKKKKKRSRKRQLFSSYVTSCLDTSIALCCNECLLFFFNCFNKSTLQGSCPVTIWMPNGLLSYFSLH